MSNVIQIGDFALTRNRDKHFQRNGDCRHMHVSCDDVGEIVTCDDCGKQVSTFWAMCMLASEWDRLQSKLETRAAQLNADQAASLHLTAARRLEKAWHSKTMVPACPHCS